MIKHLIFVTTAIFPAAVMAHAADVQPAEWRAGTGEAVNVPKALVDPTEGNIPAALQRWRTLSLSQNYAFSEYAQFLISYPDWPNAEEMRKNAEQAIDLNSYSPSQAVAFFDRLEPLTNGGRAKFAIALAANGDQARAEKWAKRAWREGPLTDDDSLRIQQLLGSKISGDDYDARVGRLLWSGATRAATPLMGLTSADRRPVLEARLALQTKSPDAAAKYAAAGDAALTDAGLLLDRAAALKAAGDIWGARSLLANRQPLSAPPALPKEWLKALYSYAKGANDAGSYDIAYGIASKVSDALPAGQKMADQDLTTRDNYTNLAWMAGMAALNKLNRPADAAEMFRQYSLGAKTPQTISKGLYWAGIAAQHAGNAALGQKYLGDAAQYFDYFHGQLALEALGRQLPAVPNPRPLPQLSAASLSPTFNAARLASKYMSWKDQSEFLRTISKAAKTPEEHLQAFALSQTIGRPDLMVMTGRNARANGITDLIPYGFPTVNVPAGYEAGWTMIHAISRQESQFDRAIVSHAGAKGLMQLMPGTAKQTAGSVALAYRPAALTSDTDYNIQLGSTYFQQMLSKFGGSYPLAVAAYNAGPGNVNKWLNANGDPRYGGINMLDWIEAIPLFETRNYVYRVLENAVMYDHLNPDRANVRSKTPLSVYLGLAR